MKPLVLALALAVIAPAWAESAELVFEGPWKTTNRKLDGIMTSVVTELGSEEWQGRFYGVWQGVRFEYIVKFSGPDSDLRGAAVIDGADYQWTGSIDRTSPGRFQGTFTGSRYLGSFDMKGTGKKPKPVGQNQ